MKKILIAVLAVLLVAVFFGGVYYSYKAGNFSPFAATTTPTLSIDPASATKQVGETFNVNLMVDTAGKAIDGIDVFYLNYNPTELQMIDCNSIQTGMQICWGSSYGTLSEFVSYAGLGGTMLPQPGEIAVGTTTAGGGSGFTGAGRWGVVKFKVLKASSGSVLSFDLGSGGSAIWENSTARNILGAANGATYVLSVPVSLPTVDLKVDNQNGPITKNAGESATLSWTSTNATSCAASGGWSGTKSTSGSQTLPNLQSSNVYSLNCRNSAGNNVIDTVSINVIVPQKNPPSVNIRANGNDGPIVIDKGTSATLDWDSQRATSCAASGDWSGTKSLNGNQSTGNIDSAKTYNLTCRNADGTTVDSVIVNVKDPVVPEQPEETAAPTEEPVAEEPASEPEAVAQAPSTNRQVPVSAQPKTKPTLTKPVQVKNTFPWAQIIIYSGIAAVMAGGLLYIYLRRRKVSKTEDELI